jgi:thioesterase domain-containing protein
MAQAIRERQGLALAPAADATAPVVTLRAGGTVPPLFCVHPAGRAVINYAGLVQHLGPDQPVYGLQDVGDDLARPVERIAAEHVRALRAVQPDGPYYLAGWSFGGYVAYEMAAQLEAQGETVAFVGLLDTLAPDLTRRRAETPDPELVLSLARDVAAQVGRPLEIDPAMLEGAEMDEMLRRAIRALREADAAPEDFDEESLREHFTVIRARNRSLAGYRAGAVRAPLHLFPARDHAEGYEAYFTGADDEERRTQGWRTVTAGPVEVHPVPGGHVTLGSEPHVPVLAQRVRQALAAARATSLAYHAVRA